jgi:outer membrane murein-binding lipoprotein Lpp
MVFCADCKPAVLRHGVLAAAVLAMLVISGCYSGPAKNAQDKPGAQQGKMARDSSDPGIDLNCVMDHIQNPPEAFHYSYNKASSNPVHEEADITPQTIDGSFKNNSASNSFHGVRSDAASWQGAWTGLMGISGMSSAVALVKNSSATMREGPEKANGYDAIKYSIDTARGTAEEKALYQGVLGTGGFEKGTAWVTAQGCPVKFVLDSELHLNNGSVEPIHYEVVMIRK